MIDDSYNSNPRSLLNMVRTMAEGGRGRKRLIVIAGEMLELGPDEVALHREAGREIASYGIDVLWGVRGWRERSSRARMRRDSAGGFSTLRMKRRRS